ncbi:MAG TPA: hypothetical protein VGE07_08715 [Herpetosiphonaceae bacterium]
MTFDDWRGAVGGAWLRVLLYPGGLALALALLAAWIGPRLTRRRAAPDGNRGATASWQPDIAEVGGLAACWLAIALLPLPGAAPLRQSIDLPTAWALLDLPLLAVAWRSLAGPAGGAGYSAGGGARLVTGWLVSLPLLALLLALCGTAVGRLTLDDLPKLSQIPLLGPLALLLWLAALVPGLHCGPWSGAPPRRQLTPDVWLLSLRRLGHVLLAAHFLSASQPAPAPASGLAALLADPRAALGQTVLTLALVLALLNRAARSRSPVLAGRLVWALGLAGLAALALRSLAPAAL